MSDKVRILRVLEYVGPRDLLAKQLSQNVVKNYQEFGEVTIREAFISNYPEVLEQAKEQS